MNLSYGSIYPAQSQLNYRPIYWLFPGGGTICLKMKNQSIYVCAARRSAIGVFNGSLSAITAPEIAATVITSLAAKKILNEVDEVLLGNVLSAGIGQNPARIAATYAGLAHEIPATTINQVCASGLRSIALAHDLLQLGKRQLVVAGGMENMSQAPYLLTENRSGRKLGHRKLIDSLVHDGLWCALTDQHMGATAENLVKKYKITRKQMDTFAHKSHQKAVKATRTGKFNEEIVPMQIKNRKDTVSFALDEQPRIDSNVLRLAGLKPVFLETGQVTAGNSSTINDGAAAVLIARELATKKLRLKPMARVVDYAVVALDPNFMGLGAALAAQKCLQQMKMKTSDIDLWEINEAFAAQALTVINKLHLDPEKVNVNGGAIALGHPIGASGARIVTTLLHEMQKQKVRFGVASLCVGGGQGIAMLFERV